jgi:hypothetical protein
VETILGFKLLPCLECLVLSCGWLISFCRLYANVSDHSIPSRLWRRNRQSDPKHWHLNYRHWWITQKKAYNKQKLYYIDHSVKKTRQMYLISSKCVFVSFPLRHYCFVKLGLVFLKLVMLVDIVWGTLNCIHHSNFINNVSK